MKYRTLNLDSLKKPRVKRLINVLQNIFYVGS